KRNSAAEIALMFHGVIGNHAILPRRRDARVAAYSKLRHESIDHSKESCAVVEPTLHQIIEAVDAKRRPRSVNFDNKRSATRLERYPKLFRGRLSRLSGIDYCR